MKLKRRILAVLLTLAVMVTFMPFISQQAYAASSSKVQVVTKAKSNNGNTSYTYNKKGLVSKAVSKSSYKTNGEYDDEVGATVAKDVSDSVTTTYKYNKKNKISKKTTKEVQKATYYSVDKTTGKSLVANLGTVTTTWTTTTVFTYNKKGLATKSVATSKTAKSGSITTSSNYRLNAFDEDDEIDGKLVYTYNEYGLDGKYYGDKQTSANVVYYTGDINNAVGSGSTTTTYAPTANGYSKTVATTSASNGSYYTQTSNTRVYFKGEWGKDVTPVASDADWDDYVDVCTEAKVVPSTGKVETSYVTSDKSEYANTNVTTTTYKYDKKKRVKSATSTSVHTYDSTDFGGGYKMSAVTKWSDGSSRTVIRDAVDKNVWTDTDTSVTTYTYDKKGRAKKRVVSDNGVENSTSTYSKGLENYSREDIAADGAKSTYSSVESGPAFKYVSSVVTANGTKTATSTDYEYTETVNNNGTLDTYTYNKDSKPTVTTKSVKATPSKYAYTYSYDKNGNLKKTKATETMTKWSIVVDETYGNTIGEFDLAGEYQDKEVAVTTTTKYSKTLENAVKAGTKRLNKVLSMLNNYKEDRETSSGYKLTGRTVYTLKAKSLKSSLAKLAEQQQWALQNGALNGVVGLN